MNARTQNQYEERARIVKAMAHPSRLFIVDELSRGERCVCELTALVGADISTVSKHLSVLKKVGIVADRKDGLMVYYRLKTPCIMKFFECVEGVQQANGRTRKSACCGVKQELLASLPNNGRRR